MSNERSKRVLHIDLTTKRLSLKVRPDLEEYLGGVGVAAKLLEENMKPNLPYDDPAQPLIFCIGALSTVFPVVTKTVCMFISPLTGELGESYAGGRLAMAMFSAGYDAVVITGKSPQPVYIAINDRDVAFRDATSVWGMDCEEIGQIIRDREPGAGKRSIIRIGPAGEKGVSFACINVDSYRHFGRLGSGAVMGSKNLKAISILGSGSHPIKSFPSYFKTFREIYDKCTDTSLMSKYHDSGTPANIEPMNLLNALPTHNLQSGTFEHAAAISGESFAKNNLTQKLACTGCPVGCIHLGQVRHEFDEGYEYETLTASYDYELIFSLGTFIGIRTTDEVLRIIDKVEYFGLDAMSTGVALGWATEALERGIVTQKETLFPLAFGDCESYLLAVEAIAARKNEFYHTLGQGVRTASAKYGGADFAMHIAGNEMPGYHTGYGALIGAAVGARHSHLCNGGYSIDQSMKEYDGTKLVDQIFAEEVERCMLNSLIICLFARKVYDRPAILKALKSVGYDMNETDLEKIAKRVYCTKLRIKKALGFRQMSVRFPKRFFETPGMHGTMEEGEAYRLMEAYSRKAEELLAMNS
jgi:aldehyde:ferredoxin oxidoreductase